MRLQPSPDKPLPTPARSWEQERVVGYVAQYTNCLLYTSDAADSGEGPPMHTFLESRGPDGSTSTNSAGAKRQREAE